MKFISNKIQFDLTPTTVMRPIKLFRAAQTYFDAMGLYVRPESSVSCQFNRKNGFYISAVAGVVIPVMGFLFVKAKTSYEYSISFYILITTVCMTVHFMVYVDKLGSIPILIENYQDFIGKRKRCCSCLLGKFWHIHASWLRECFNWQGMAYNPTSAGMYTDVDAKIEWVTKWSHVILTEVGLAGALLPILLLSLVNYYVLGLEDQSFALPWPMLCVSRWSQLRFASYTTVIPLLQIAIRLENTARIFTCVCYRMRCFSCYSFWWHNNN